MPNIVKRSIVQGGTADRLMLFQLFTQDINKITRQL